VDKAQIAQTLLLDPLNEATSLFRRYQDAPGLRGYIQDRMRFLVPIGALMVLISLGCTAATVLYLGGTRPVLVLLAMLIAPFVLFGRSSGFPAGGSRRTYGTTVKVLPPGPAWWDQGPQPASEPGAHVAPAGQARAIAL